jgi:hypothetical protein
MPIPDPIPGSRWSMRILRNAAGPIFLMMLFGGGALVAGEFLDEEYRWLSPVGGWLLGVGVALTLVVPFTAMYFVAHEALAGYPHRQAIERPTMPVKVDAEAREIEDGLASLGFEHEGWVRLDDFDETHSGLWRHPTHGAVAVLLYLPVGAACKLRFGTSFPDGWRLTSSTRLADISTPTPPDMYLQVWPGATAEGLWHWHLEAESLFPARSSPRAPANPPPVLEECLEVTRRIARFHTRRWLWFLRQNPVREVWRVVKWKGVSVREQIDRGWVPDPATTFPDPTS